ncbi:amino acid transporter [Kingella kingae]|uniref:amino acid transporter n=1 Tax=Kingella kingae TaxID=504 RepID=UPI002553A170|nr:amino acid transporter [Kingella kingae]MDK4623877.1 amino acid transporter [Kingella kingae]MDK4659653.1 amino acid transporter [Kingella kingae]MDK4667410.1 amino acid transporter [Kingella kingae]MDK4686020.1 amino acid transporter [Kingella kingae]
MNSTKATLIGLLAVVSWSAVIGLFRRMSELYGAIGNATLTTVAAILLLLLQGLPKLSWFSPRYL